MSLRNMRQKKPPNAGRLFIESVGTYFAMFSLFVSVFFLPIGLSFAR